MWRTLIVLFLLWRYLPYEGYFNHIESIYDVIDGVVWTFAELYDDVDSLFRYAYAER
jgi:hypothetical protein